MGKGIYKKGLVAGIIILFVVLVFQSAFAIENKTSNESLYIDSNEENTNKNVLNGPDLKIEKVYITEGWKGHYWVCFITCDVINNGEPVAAGYLDIRSEVWRWNSLTKTYESWGAEMGSSQGNYYWDSFVTKKITGSWATDFRFGTYRIKFRVKITGDVNQDNNCFDRNFLSINGQFFPSDPYGPPIEYYLNDVDSIIENNHGMLQQAPTSQSIEFIQNTGMRRDKATTNGLLLRFLDQFPLLQKISTFFTI
jgi:hypothetical protein